MLFQFYKLFWIHLCKPKESHKFSCKAILLLYTKRRWDPPVQLLIYLHTESISIRFYKKICIALLLKFDNFPSCVLCDIHKILRRKVSHRLGHLLTTTHSRLSLRKFSHIYSYLLTFTWKCSQMHPSCKSTYVDFYFKFRMISPLQN